MEKRLEHTLKFNNQTRGGVQRFFNRAVSHFGNVMYYGTSLCGKFWYHGCNNN